VQTTVSQTATSIYTTPQKKSPKSNENSVEMCIFAWGKVFEGLFRGVYARR